MQKQFANIAALGLLTATASAQPSYPSPDELIYDNVMDDPGNLVSFSAFAFDSTTLPIYGVPAQQVIFDGDYIVEGIGTFVTVTNSDGTGGFPSALLTRNAAAWQGGVSNFFDDPLGGDYSSSVPSSADDFSFYAQVDTTFVYLVINDLPDFQVSAGEEWWFGNWFDKPGDFTFDVPAVVQTSLDFGMTAHATSFGDFESSTSRALFIIGRPVPAPGALVLAAAAGFGLSRRGRESSR